MRRLIRSRWAVGLLAVTACLLVLGGVAYRNDRRMASAAVREANIAADLARLDDLAQGIDLMQAIPVEYLATGDRSARKRFVLRRAETTAALVRRETQAASQQEWEIWTQVDQNLSAFFKAANTILLLDDPVGNPHGPGLMVGVSIAAASADSHLRQIRQLDQAADRLAREQAARAESTMQAWVLGSALAMLVLGFGIALLPDGRTLCIWWGRWSLAGFRLRARWNEGDQGAGGLLQRIKHEQV